MGSLVVDERVLQSDQRREAARDQPRFAGSKCENAGTVSSRTCGSVALACGRALSPSVQWRCELYRSRSPAPLTNEFFLAQVASFSACLLLFHQARIASRINLICA